MQVHYKGDPKVVKGLHTGDILVDKMALISISARISANKRRNNIVDQQPTTMASKKEAAHTASCLK